MKNKYINHAKISEAKFRQILNLFCIDIEASKVAEIFQVSRPTINKFFYFLEKEFNQYKGTLWFLAMKTSRLMNHILKQNECETSEEEG